MSNLSRGERRVREESRKFQRRTLFIAAAACLAAVAGVATPIIYQRMEAEASDIAVVEDWGNSNYGCGLQSLAMMSPLPAAEGKVDLSEVTSLSTAQAPVRAGLWESGFLQLNLSAADSSSFTVLSLTVIDRKKLENPPQWIYVKSYGGCGSLGDKSVFLTARIDKPSVRPSSQDTSFAAFQGGAFEPFSVTKDAAATFKVRNDACQENWQFSLQLKYQKAGESQTRFKTFGPFNVYGTNPGIPVRLASPEGNLTPSSLADPLVNLWRYAKCPT